MTKIILQLAKCLILCLLASPIHSEPEETKSHTFNLNFLVDVSNLEEINENIKNSKILILFIKNNPALEKGYQQKVETFLNEIQIQKLDQNVIFKTIDCLDFKDFCEHEDYKHKGIVLESMKQFYTVSVTLEDIENETKSAQRVVKEMFNKDVHKPENFSEMEDFVSSFYTQKDVFMFVFLSRDSYDVEYFKRLLILLKQANLYSFKELVWILGEGEDFKKREDMKGMFARFYKHVPLYLGSDTERVTEENPDELLYKIEDSGWVKMDADIQTANDHEGEGFIEDKHRVENINDVMKDLNLAAYRHPVFIDNANFLSFETYMLENKMYLILNSGYNAKHMGDVQATTTHKASEMISKYMRFARKYNREALDYRKIYFGVLDVGSQSQDYVLENYLNRFGEDFFENLGEYRLVMVGPKRDKSNVTVEFLNNNIFEDEELEEMKVNGSEIPNFSFDNLSRFIENFFDNRHREVNLKSEQLDLTPPNLASNDYVQRFNGASLAEQMASTEWENHLVLLVCASDEDDNCHLAATFLQFLKRTNPEVNISFGFVDEVRNEIDKLFKDSDLSPRFYLVNKFKRYRPEIYGKEFGYVSFVNWINENIFQKEGDKVLEFDDEQQDELLLEIAKIRGDEEQIKRAVELRRLERENNQADISKDL